MPRSDAPLSTEIQNLAKQLPPDQQAHGLGNIVLAQINPNPGDLAGNATQTLQAMVCAKSIQADLIVFPELNLMGYPIRDVVTRHPSLVEQNIAWLNALAKHSKKTLALVGFVEPRHPKNNQPLIGKPYYNSVAILGRGQILGIVRKSLLPQYAEFEDPRVFEPAPQAGIYPAETLGQANLANINPAQTFECHGHHYAISICEDTWNDAHFFEARQLYPNDPIAKLLQDQTNVAAMINLSASPSRARKEQLKHNMLAHIAKKYKIPYVYVNQVGAVDELSFDGASRVYNAQGDLVARAKSFEAQYLVVNPVKETGSVEPLPIGLKETLTAKKFFDAYDTTDLGRIYQSVVQGIKDYFAKTGFKKAVLGLSGGLDSTVTAVLLADALGGENVIGVSMPTRLTPQENRDDAQTLASNLDIIFVECPIDPSVSAVTTALNTVAEELTQTLGPVDKHSNATDNVQAITRATILRQIGNNYRALPIATSDKSELYLGYATVNGDMSGALAPLGDVTKSKVRALFHWMNTHRDQKNALPKRIVEKPSGADLKTDPSTGELVTAEDELMPYAFADEIIWRIENLGDNMSDMLSADFQYEKTHPIPKEQKEKWLQKFYDRMSKAVFKWFIMPPIILVASSGSITKTDYHHPITSNNITWQGHSQNDITTMLDQVAQRTEGTLGPASTK